MKKKIFLNVVLFLFAGNVFAQSGWVLQNPYPQDKTLNDCQFIGPNTIVAVGDSCRIIKSTDGGNIWKKVLDVGNTFDLLRLQFVNENTGYASGAGTSIYKTTNGGDSWSNLPVPGSEYYIKGISFINANTGVLTGWRSLVVKTTNGGMSWNDISPSFSDYWEDVFCFDENNIIISHVLTGFPTGNVFKTTNGGLNWINISPVSGPPYYTIQDIHFININTGFVSGNPVMRTTNGGINWISCNFSATNGKFSFRDSTIGFCSAANSATTILKTTNIGLTWNPTTTTSIFQQINGLCISPTNNLGFAVGNSGSIAKTVDLNEWVTISSVVTSRKLTNIRNIDDSTAIISGDYGSILRSKNYGANWEKVNPTENIHYNSLSFINSLTGYAGGWFYSYPPLYQSAKILKTTNGGFNWSQLYFSTSIGELRNIFFLNENTGYLAAKSPNLLYKTSNGGTNWSNISMGIFSSYIEGIHFVNDNTGFIWNTEGINRTTNGGDSWVPGPAVNDVSKLMFLNNSQGFLLTSTQLMFTSNSGINWNLQNSSLTGNRSMFFFNTNTGYVLNSGSVISYTTNGGITFSNQLNPPAEAYDICFLSPNKGFFVGNEGLIMRTTSGGFPIGIITEIKLTPDNFSLSQNYPNPFNPSTKINYEIKSSGFVSLKVFDLLGKEVATLVNEKQNAGSYAIDFNSSEFSLPSGIYFYTLTASEFTETRKMVLIK